MAVGFIEHNGCRVLVTDYSRMRRDQVLLQMDEARRFLTSLPKRREIFALVDVSEMQFDDEVLQRFKAAIIDDEPWQRALAVCGLQGLGRVAFRALNLMTGMRMRGFEKREDALTWLHERWSRPQ